MPLPGTSIVLVGAAIAAAGVAAVSGTTPVPGGSLRGTARYQDLRITAVGSLVPARLVPGQTVTVDLLLRNDGNATSRLPRLDATLGCRNACSPDTRAALDTYDDSQGLTITRSRRPLADGVVTTDLRAHTTRRIRVEITVPQKTRPARGLVEVCAHDGYFGTATTWPERSPVDNCRSLGRTSVVASTEPTLRQVVDVRLTARNDGHPLNVTVRQVRTAYRSTPDGPWTTDPTATTVRLLRVDVPRPYSDCPLTQARAVPATPPVTGLDAPGAALPSAEFEWNCRGERMTTSLSMGTLAAAQPSLPASDGSTRWSGKLGPGEIDDGGWDAAHGVRGAVSVTLQRTG